MINDEIVLKAERCLFGNIELPKEFHEKLKHFMNRRKTATHVVVLYKVSKNFKKLLESFPELPDIGRKEVVLMDSGNLMYTPDYYYKSLQTISINTFVNDEILNKICQRLFGTSRLPKNFLQAFKDFITDPFWNYGIQGLELCKLNRKFMEFLEPFYRLIPDIGMKKLTIYANGSIHFTPNFSRIESKEIFLK